MEDDVLDLAESIARRRNEPPLTADLIRRFGGRGFIFNLRMWEGVTRNGPSCCYVPADDHYRRRFETLACTGVAVRGAAVPPNVRFSALSMAELREAAKALGAGKLRDRKTSARVVAERPGAEAWLHARYELNDFFLLQPESWSYQQVERLWHDCTHAARDELAREAS